MFRSASSILFLSTLLALPALRGASWAKGAPWTSPYPDMRNFSLPKPADHRPVSAAEWQVDWERARQNRSFLPIFGSRKECFNEVKELARTRQYQEVMTNFNRYLAGEPDFMHYGNTFKGMNLAARIYFGCGDLQLGRYIRDYTLHAITLPDWFWLGQETLVPGWEKRKNGSLITASLARTFTEILVFAGDVFSPQEKARVEAALRKNCHESCLRFVKNFPRLNNNFASVIAGGLLVTSKYFGDANAQQAALSLLRHYVQNALEEDGSYGEGLHYFSYGFNSLYPSFQLMTPEERRQVFGKTPLRHSAGWLACHYYFRRVMPGQRQGYKAAFGDSNFFSVVPQRLLKMLAELYGGELPGFLAGDGEGEVPDILKKQPLVQAFANGESFMRSSWTGEGIVVAAQIHHPVRAASHRRMESGSFSLAINGFPVVMHAGNTNLYRRPIHQYAMRTSSANTLTFAGKDQLPVKGQANRLLLASSGTLADVLAFELRSSYAPEFGSIRRFLILLKSIDTLVVLDHLQQGRKPVTPVCYLHFNNLRHNAVLKSQKDGWLYRHPLQSLRLHVGGSMPVETGVEKGYIVSDLASIWNEAAQEKEQEKGNAFKFHYSSKIPVSNGILYAVLSWGKEAEVPVFQQEMLTINPFTIRLEAEGITVSGGERRESFLICQDF